MQPTPAPSSPPASPPAAEDATTYPAPPKNKGSAPFHVLAALFERLQTERKPDKRRKLLASWFNHWRKEIGPDLFPVLRLILPQKDRERAVYGLKEKNLAKAYIKLIPLGRTDPDAIRLLNWKKPTDREKTSGDFPTVLFEVVNKRSSVVEGSLSINEDNPEEQKWIVRIILKDMIISVKENTVFSVFHPDAHDLFNTCSDLKKVAWELWDPNRRLNDEDKAVQLFRAFAPMLCKRPTKKIEDSVKEMQGRTFIIEEKLDGERIQLHKRGNEYFYCSRKGKDYTYLYGKHVGTGSLTPYIDAAFDDRVEEIILDGEMLVWDPVSERNLPFGTLKTAALDKSKKEHNPRPCFKVFDLLYLNGRSLLQKSTKNRKRNLRTCLQEVPGRIEFVIEHEGKTAKDVRTRMEDIITNRGEGLVLKHPSAGYVLNGRNKDWIKVKPEYMDNMGETMDVLVRTGGNYGTGRRSGGVSTLICAVLDDRRANDDEDPKYSTFVRIGSGLSYADYIWIRQKPWKPWGTNGPSFLQCSRKGHEDKGDIYLEPEDSFIVKIKAAEIVSSDLYHLSFTMRFPRALHIREDLSIADCMTATAMLEGIRSEKKRKMEEEEEEKPKKKTKKTGKKPTIMPEYQGVSLKNIPVESNLFEGHKFMVSSDPKSRTGAEDKQALLQMIHAHGGKYVQFARDDPNLLVVYGGQITPYDLKLIMKKDVCDVIRPQWILDCVAKGEIVPLTKKYFFHATTARKEMEEYNAGDSDTEEEPSPPASPTASGTSKTPENDRASLGPSGRGKQDGQGASSASSQIDPSMAEWFDVGAKSSTAPSRDSGSDSETEPEPDEPEPDSENDDVRDREAGFDDDDDDWEQVGKESDPSHPKASDSKGKEKVKDEVKDEDGDGGVRMGEDDSAMHYDEEKFFKHLCFYLDSPSNARKHGMGVKAKNEADVEKRFTELAKMITDNGGRVVDLDEPKLTHIVLDKRDVSRRQELIKRTSKPKRRHLVIAEFIEICVEEATLMDEDGEWPACCTFGEHKVTWY
ncbi:ATP dependent DNA ligase domain-containing protein [Daedaleopsis nitida]|nr:ATP dependent DNA ligase domain-containing protein [Daedaleopsis nitida]